MVELAHIRCFGALMTDPVVKSDFDEEVAAGERFEFGNNWTRFLRRLNEKRIEEAETSLKLMLELNDLQGRSFLDIGCGSGLFSLAASRLGANPIHSFDYDTQSVACCEELKRRFFPKMDSWSIAQASILDEKYYGRLGKFDIVYSWGVLHHTGHMWKAIENSMQLVKPGGTIFVSLYNDQGLSSKIWLRVKKLYNKTPIFLRFLILIPAFIRLWGPTFIRNLAIGEPGKKWKEYIHDRGMSPWDDVVDWVGGYPFEVATPGETFTYFHKRGFSLHNMKTSNNIGCNEFVFHLDFPHGSR
jgi:2-polyprenyl-3-methyl-5-hydroxy-6-metoxy-1,4-benzoquinol methylase